MKLDQSKERSINQQTFRCGLVLFTPSRYTEDNINIVAVVGASEHVEVQVQAARLQAFAGINKLFPYGMASMNSCALTLRVSR
jgi:hypothetical protein